VPETREASARIPAINHVITTIGRLRRGVSIDAARAEIAALTAQELGADGGTEADYRPTVDRLDDVIVGSARTPLIVLFGAVGLVLLIACVNTASMLVAKTVGRSGELAVRVALGAGRGELAAQLMTESLVLGFAGGAIGWGIAAAGVRALVAFAPPTIPRLSEVSLDGTVMVVTAATSIVLSLLCGVVPALRATRVDPAGALQEGGGRSGGAGRHAVRLREVLVVSELALALSLLVAAALMIRSYRNLTLVDPGFRTDRVISVGVTLPDQRYPDLPSRGSILRQIGREVEAIPGVVAVSGVSSLPFRGDEKRAVGTEAAADVPLEQRPVIQGRTVTAGFLDTLDIPLRAGRDLTEEETWQTSGAVLINETAARLLFGRDNPIGRRLRFGARAWQTVVGVVGDIRQRQLSAPPLPEAYLPFAHDRDQTHLIFLVRTQGDANAVVPAFRTIVRRLDPRLSLSHLVTLDAVMGESVAQPRFATSLLTLMSGVAVMLALVGTYGLMAFVVRGRRRELAVRAALGATRADLIRMMLAGGGRLIAVGVSIGLGLAIALGRVLRTQLFDVSPSDPAAIAVALMVVVGAALVACLVPTLAGAARAPSEALRNP
jgi:putative ABC transport system permease protein